MNSTSLGKKPAMAIFLGLPSQTVINWLRRKPSGKYLIEVKSNDSTLGTTTGSGEYHYDTSVQIEAIESDIGRFVRWDDNNQDQIRTIVVTKNKTYTAIFINKNSGTLHYVKNENYINQDFRK